MKPGDRLVGWVEEGRLIVRPGAELIRELQEQFRRKPGEESFVQALRRMRNKEAARDRNQ